MAIHIDIVIAFQGHTFVGNRQYESAKANFRRSLYHEFQGRCEMTNNRGERRAERHSRTAINIQHNGNVNVLTASISDIEVEPPSQ